MGDTPVTFDEQLRLIAMYPAAVKQAALNSEDRLVDLVGIVHSNQSAIRGMKRGWMAEIEDGDRGHNYEIQIPAPRDRSYNTSALLEKLMAAGEMTLPQLLQYLVMSDVIRINWQWTNLKRELRVAGIGVRIAGHEIADGDPDWDIGEIDGKGSPKFVPLETEEA